MGELLKIVSRSITEWVMEEDTTSEVVEANEDNSVITIDAEDAKAKPGKANQAVAETAAVETLTTIAYDCDNVLALQGFPKSHHTHQERHAGRDSVNVRPRVHWKQVPWGIRCGFCPNRRTKLTFCDFPENQNCLCRGRRKYLSTDRGSPPLRHRRHPLAIQ